MPCFSPLKAYSSPGPDGRLRIRFKLHRGCTPLELPCGQCIGCRLQKAREWATRITHEASLHRVSIFLTLTYDDEHLPPGGTLVKRDVQLFFKRLRKQAGKLRYYVCGEYGDRTCRPHYHAIIFGWCPTDGQIARRKQEGSLYTSSSLTKIWGLGSAVYGAVNVSTAEYCARYALKKVTGSLGSEYYGELLPPFARMSRRPGVGAGWIDQYQADCYPSDNVVLKGKIRGKPPRYYDNRVKDHSPEVVDAAKRGRKAYAQEPRQVANSTRARLLVRKTVLEANLAQRKREL